MADDLRASVTILTLGEESGGCGGADGSCRSTASCAAPRVPALACRDALTAAGRTVNTVTACSDAEIDAVVATLDGPPRADGLTFPATEGGPVLIVAVASDGQLRAVVRRMVRRYAPPPSRRPVGLASGRTVADLPAIGVLPLDPRGGRMAADLVDRLGLPRDPADLAKAVLAGRTRPVDLLRNDGGSVTLHGVLLGGVDASGAAVSWRGRIEVDDAVLADGREPVLACAVANADGYAYLDELPLTPAADPADGAIAVAVAVPVEVRGKWGKRSMRVEVRRASGRAVSVTPGVELPFADDGVPGTLTHKRSWWVEPGAWSVFTL
jgi:hypothetical protein